VKQFIFDSPSRNVPPTFDSILDFIEQELNISMLPDTLRHKIYSSPDLKTIEGIPMEQERVHADPDEIAAFYQELESILKNIPAAMIYNLDESGFADFVDAKKAKVIVPVEFPSDDIPIPVDRSVKRASLLTCISAGGGYLKPLIIVPRKSVETELYNLGFTPNNVMIKSQENGFLNTEIFEEWIEECFVPAVAAERDRLDYWGDAVLLLDSCSPHCSDFVENICNEEGILVVFIPPHSSDQVQPLDLGIFGHMKQAAGRVNPPKWVSPQTKQLMKILCAMQANCTPPNIISAFS
jgi:hypothetical protein